MADIIRIDQATVDLDKPLSRTSAGKVLATGDQMANRFSAQVVRRGQPVDLSGCSVKGYFIRPDQETISFTGAVRGNTAYVDLPRACYLEEGRFYLSVKISSGNMTLTLRVIEGWIVKTQSDSLTDSGGTGGDSGEEEDATVQLYTADGELFYTSDGAIFSVMGG